MEQSKNSVIRCGSMMKSVYKLLYGQLKGRPDDETELNRHVCPEFIQLNMLNNFSLINS